jgi:hypothetical protein
VPEDAVTSGHPAGWLPPELGGLRDLALDLRWTWSHEADAIWRRVDETAWESTQNPWVVLQVVSRSRLAALAADASFRGELDRITAARAEYMRAAEAPAAGGAGIGVRGIAYFSMEFVLGEALPLYAGGLGILPATRSRRQAISACRSSASGCSTRAATSASGSTPPDGSRRRFRSTSRRACRSSGSRRMAGCSRSASRCPAVSCGSASGAPRSVASRSTSSTATIP